MCLKSSQCCAQRTLMTVQNHVICFPPQLQRYTTYDNMMMQLTDLAGMGSRSVSSEWSMFPITSSPSQSSASGRQRYSDYYATVMAHSTTLVTQVYNISDLGNMQPQPHSQAFPASSYDRLQCGRTEREGLPPSCDTMMLQVPDTNAFTLISPATDELEKQDKFQLRDQSYLQNITKFEAEPLKGVLLQALQIQKWLLFCSVSYTLSLQRFHMSTFQLRYVLYA